MSLICHHLVLLDSVVSRVDQSIRSHPRLTQLSVTSSVPAISHKDASHFVLYFLSVF